MKKLISMKWVVICIVIHIVTITALFFTCENRINDTVIILPSLILISIIAMILHKKKIIKTTAFIIPTISGLLFSLIYVVLQFRIYDTKLNEQYPFSNVIYNQFINICLGVILSVILLFVNNRHFQNNCFERNEKTRKE